MIFFINYLFEFFQSSVEVSTEVTGVISLDTSIVPYVHLWGLTYV